MAKQTANKNLRSAKTDKKDEFYTQLSDIEKELKHYKNHFKGKVVLCNCDDPSAVDGDLYMMKNGIVEVPYARILIKHKKI